MSSKNQDKADAITLAGFSMTFHGKDAITPVMKNVHVVREYRRAIIACMKEWDSEWRDSSTLIARLRSARICQQFAEQSVDERQYSAIIAMPTEEKNQPGFGMPDFKPQVMGYILYREFTYHHQFIELLSIGVNFDERRQGIGSRLIRALTFSSRNAKYFATLDPKYLEACALLKSMGCICQKAVDNYIFQWNLGTIALRDNALAMNYLINTTELQFNEAVRKKFLPPS